MLKTASSSKHYSRRQITKPKTIFTTISTKNRLLKSTSFQYQMSQTTSTTTTTYSPTTPLPTAITTTTTTPTLSITNITETHQAQQQPSRNSRRKYQKPNEQSLLVLNSNANEIAAKVKERLLLLNSSPDATTWTATNPSTGSTTVPGYEGVLINPDLLLKGDELQQHYNNAWDIYKNKMNSPQTICAPMVEQSELPFRLLSRKYSIDLCYTPMLNSNTISTMANLDKQFETTIIDQPLTVQICGASIDLAVQLCTLLQSRNEPMTDININLGCPQGIAKRGRYGSFLLEETLHVQRIVRSLRDVCNIPITVKMRKLLNDPTHQRTISYAKALQDSGATIITLHGRTRLNKKDKLGQVDLDAIKALKSQLTIPIFANGGVGSYFDAKRIQQYTNTDGIMISEGLLSFPTMIQYPIRPSQLLGPNERNKTEEGYYSTAIQDENVITRQHYSYPIFNKPELKDHIYYSLPQHLQQLPKLSSLTNIYDLSYIDQYCGPDSLQIAAELIHTTLSYKEQWKFCLRPHLFKILHRILATHTDIRTLYAMFHTDVLAPPRFDYCALQLIRQRELYTWKKFQNEVITTLCHKLNIPLTTPITNIDTTSLTTNELHSILINFPFHSLSEHLDILPYFHHQLTQLKLQKQQQKQQQQSTTTTDQSIETTESHHITNEKGFNNDDDVNDNNTNDGCPCDDETIAPTNPIKPSQEQQNQPGYTAPKIKPATPQIFDNHQFPSSTHPWAMDNSQCRLMHIVEQGRGPKTKLQFAHKFKIDEWLQQYEQFCIQEGYLQPPEDQQQQQQQQESNTTTITPSTKLCTPTIKGYNPNYVTLANEWKSRVIQDHDWVKLFRLDSPSTILPTTTTTTITMPTPFPTIAQDQIQSIPLLHYVIPLPLESLWFFERLYSLQNHWYYRYDHSTEVVHFSVDDDSIQHQLFSMLQSRQQKEQKLQETLAQKNRPGPKQEERQKNKQIKLQRKLQQKDQQPVDDNENNNNINGNNNNDDDVTMNNNTNMNDDNNHTPITPINSGQIRQLTQHSYSDDEIQPQKRQA